MRGPFRIVISSLPESANEPQIITMNSKDLSKIEMTAQRSSEPKYHNDAGTQKTKSAEDDVEIAKPKGDAVSQTQGDAAEGEAKQKGPKTKDLAQDPTVLAKIVWSDHRSPDMALGDRIGAATAMLQEILDEVPTWKVAGKPACGKCKGVHPPPCLNKEELDVFRVAKFLLFKYQKMAKKAEDAASVTDKDKAAPAKKVEKAGAQPPVCSACFTPHWGKCRKPACRDCKIKHWRGAGGISCEEAMATRKEAIKVNPRLLGVAGSTCAPTSLQQKKEEDDDNDDELSKFAEFCQSLPAGYASMASKLFSKVFGNKRKEPPTGESGRGKKTKS